MAKSSGSTRAAPLKTHSRRVNITTERPPAKRKLSEDSQSVVELPPAKKFARSSIQSYFQPLSSSSSPAPTRSARHSSDCLEPVSTPPSSAPSKAASPPIPERRPPKRPKRRLSTKPKSVPTVTMPRTCNHRIEDCDCLRRGSPISRSSPIPCKQSPLKFALPVAADRLKKQTRLSLGNAESNEFCKLCGLLYDPTIREDRAAHEAQHAEKVTCDPAGVDFDDVTVGTHVIGLDDMLYIRVTRKSASHFRRFAARVVDKVDAELGYVTSENLWELGRRFQVFIAMLNGQPIGALVAEPIAKAGSYSRGYELHESGPMKELLSKEVVSNAINMCVDRLWVDPNHRGGATNGVHFAWRLMEQARQHFIPNYVIPKYKVAFSRPSDQGYVFACKYFAGAFENVSGLKGKHVKMLVNSDESVESTEPV